MLFAPDFVFICRFAFHDLRQTLVIVIDDIVAAFFIDTHEAVKHDNLARGAQADLFVIAFDIYRGPFQPCSRHLTRNGALPDQIVELALIGLRELHRGRIARHIGGPDALMGFLRVLGFIFVHARAVRHIFGAIAVLDGVAGRHNGLWRHVDTVCPHVRDETRLIETLGRAHGLTRTHAELPAGLLLQRGRHERGGRIAIGGFCLDAHHFQISALDGLHSQLCLRFILYIVAVELFAR